ncbi:hypothetical protein BC937DRAFT_94413, partial [Endogone sp. FLAS-F59071]
IFGDLLNFSTLKDYYDRNDLGRIAQEVMKGVLKEKFISEIMEQINQRLSIQNNDYSTEHITAAILGERENTFIDFVDHQRQPVYAEELKKTFADCIKDLRISEAMKKEYADTLLKALEKMCTTARQEFKNRKGHRLVQVAIHDAIQDIRKWIDFQVSKSTTANAVRTKCALVCLFDKKWILRVNQTYSQLKEMQPSQETIDQNLRNDFYTVFKSMPSLTILNNLISTERNDDLVLDILSRLDPELLLFRLDWYTVMEKNYITRSQ